MSDECYTKWWIVTRKQLEDLRAKDQVLEATTNPLTDRPFAHYFVGDLYCKYCTVLQNIAACLDQSFMVQKTFTMRKLMDAAVTRLNELKEMFVYQLNFSEFYYLDNNMVQQRLIPHDIQIIEPEFVFDRPVEIEDMWTAIKNGETIFVPPPPSPRESLDANTQTDDDEIKEIAPSVPRFQPPVVILSPEEAAELERKERLTQAVLLIQRHERARQARIYFADLDDRRQTRLKFALKLIKPDAPVEDRINAAIKMQQRWRGQLARRYFKKRETERRLLIGMTEPSSKSNKSFDDYQTHLEERRAIRYKQLREYVQADAEEKVRLLRVVGPRLLEDISEEIRQWFHTWYSEIKNFDKYPTELVGGSILVVRDETWTPQEWIDEVERIRRLKAKGVDIAKEAKKKKEAEKKAAKELKAKEKQLKKKEMQQAKQREAQGLILLKFEESVAATLFGEGFIEQTKIWDKKPDSDNPLFLPDMELIQDQRCYEVQMEIRKEVDNLMRIELALLNQALAKDTKKKYKPPKEPKAKKAKKSKDLTEHRTTEDLFQELVDNGIIHTYPKVKLSDFKGDFSYNNFELRSMNLNPSPCLGDIRNAIMVNCILPLGVNNMAKPKSVLIAGPPQSGKHLLANAIFNETKCVLFDISPPILAGKYVGKKAMVMLVHLITKMSRILQPSIIFIDGGEKPFYKKIPPEEKDNDPKKMGGVLMKRIVKPILPEDKVLVLAISKEPFNAKGKMQKTFERIILIPRPDYGSLYMYLRELLMSYHGIDRDFNVSELATLTLYHPLPLLKRTIEKVLNPIRIAQLSFKPFDAHELIEALFDEPPILTDKEWAKYEKWFWKTPLAKRRVKLIAIEEEKIAALDKNKDKKK